MVYWKCLYPQFWLFFLLDHSSWNDQKKKRGIRCIKYVTKYGDERIISISIKETNGYLNPYYKNANDNMVKIKEI